MTNSGETRWWQFPPATMVASILVIMGFVLSSVSWWFFLLTAAGTFGPGILREAGILNDRDEFQREADRRAGYHAFIVTGIVAFLMVTYYRTGEREIKNPGELPTFLLTLLWCVWFFSSRLGYWGPQKTAIRVLLAFGCVWLVFTIVSNTGSEWTGWTALLLHPLLALPFLGLAGLAKYFPRFTGLLLIMASVFFAFFFGWLPGQLTQFSDMVTPVLFLGPLLASGVGLLFVRPRTEESEEDT